MAKKSTHAISPAQLQLMQAGFVQDATQLLEKLALKNATVSESTPTAAKPAAQLKGK